MSDRVEALLGEMTLAEKVGQMTLLENGSARPDEAGSLLLGGVLSGGDGAPADNSRTGWVDMVDGYQRVALDTRLGIPLLYGVDAVHGHGLLAGATVFPHNVGLGASGDADLVREIGRATAAEVSATGVTWNFAPVLAVVDDVRWGRTYESYGADPALVASLGAAYVEGLTRDDLDRPVLATAKHWIGDGSVRWQTSTNPDFRIDQGDVPADDALLRDVLIPPYVAAFEAGARTTMASFSSWGGQKVHGSEALLTDVLRGAVGFDGFVVSDWAGIDQIVPDDVAASIEQAILAGIDMSMVPSDGQGFQSALVAAVEAGRIPLARIDEAVTRILTVKFELGLFERPLAAAIDELDADDQVGGTIASDEHRALARRAVAASAVLLQNDGVLPLGDDSGVIVVGGPAADDVGRQAGGWTLSWQGETGDAVTGTSLLEGLIDRYGVDRVVLADRGGAVPEGVRPDVCIAAVGERPYAEGLGDSSALAWEGSAAVETLRTACPELVVVMMSGRPMIVTDRLPEWDAFIASWLPGSEAGGIVDVLSGDVPFTATLPVEWPASLAGVPASESIEAPLFPIGAGILTS
ncbi:MAG: glycoside hydrolase family 3 protein [Actinomycetota bacterium]